MIISNNPIFIIIIIKATTKITKVDLIFFSARYVPCNKSNTCTCRSEPCQYMDTDHTICSMCRICSSYTDSQVLWQWGGLTVRDREGPGERLLKMECEYNKEMRGRGGKFVKEVHKSCDTIL